MVVLPESGWDIMARLRRRFISGRGAWWEVGVEVEVEGGEGSVEEYSGGADDIHDDRSRRLQREGLLWKRGLILDRVKAWVNVLEDNTDNEIVTSTPMSTSHRGFTIVIWNIIL